MTPDEHRNAWYWVQALPDRWTACERPASPAPDRSWFTLRLSTDAADGDPYEFWRHRVFYDFAADRRADQSVPFYASAQAVVSLRGEFVYSRSADLAGARTGAGISQLPNANLTIGFMLSGRRDYEAGSWRHRAEAGQLYLYDAAVASRLEMSEHQVTYLSIKADAVDRVLPQGRQDHASLLYRLERSPLRPFLQMQLAMLIEARRRPDPPDSGRLLDIASDLALLMLQQAPELPDMDVGELRRGLIVAAQHVIATNLDNARLDADYIAGQLGVSRATLYRAFAGHGLTIAGHIRAIRLIRARHLIEHSAAGDKISDLILRCGIEDSVHFARQFRELFGIRPSEIKGIRFGQNVV
ncbi:helix-turn-helix domain-containing protein [Pelagibacterium limicola]|uniref:helix-turn-helix domain-containing protein n=1 Tax=Pelagibacterium limicola TaxID=2791022 RepID=UPI0018AFFE92|nr:helix-turn-helix domain-containing protein [Pelagibacterium limicola]